MVDSHEISAFSISELSSLIKDGLETLFPQPFWVEGQISNFKTSRPGHCYFDLIEPNNEPGQPPAAVLNVALWQGKRTQVEKVLTDSGNLVLSNDLQVRILANLNFYPPSGRLNLIMEQIDPSFTLGQLAVEREKLLHQLLDEGLLEKNASLPVTYPPLRIGLVTSIGSAAHADFITEILNSGFGFTVLEYDTRVQGEGAVAEITSGLEILSSHKPDVVALVRGGGSSADLSIFDSELVARAIAELGCPVFTGIGHEIDRSVADEVAHSAYKTPTACANALIGYVKKFVEDLSYLNQSIFERAKSVIDKESRFQNETSLRLTKIVSSTIARTENKFEEIVKRVSRSAPKHLEHQSERLTELEHRLRVLDPVNVLARGWSITRHSDGQLVTKSEHVKTGDVLITSVSNGTVTSTVSSEGEK
tara:strand:- start:442 stop:1701 length:1260 start_codon:yes stop_codon:yes gene_type:complete